MKRRQTPMAIVVEALAKALAQIKLAQAAAAGCDPEMASVLGRAAADLVEQRGQAARAVWKHEARGDDSLASPVARRSRRA